MISDELFERLKNGERSAFDELVNVAAQEALRSLPLINENIIKRSAVLHEMSRKFYEDNKDLEAHKDMVAKVIERIEGQNPGMDFDKILLKAAPMAREAIKAEEKILTSSVTKSSSLKSMDDIIGKL